MKFRCGSEPYFFFQPGSASSSKSSGVKPNVRILLIVSIDMVYFYKHLLSLAVINDGDFKVSQWVFGREGLNGLNTLTEEKINQNASIRSWMTYRTVSVVVSQHIRIQSRAGWDGESVLLDEKLIAAALWVQSVHLHLINHVLLIAELFAQEGVLNFICNNAKLGKKLYECITYRGRNNKYPANIHLRRGIWPLGRDLTCQLADQIHLTPKLGFQCYGPG